MVGGCFYRRELERACERVRAGSRSAESAFIDSRENLKDGRFRSLRDSSRRLLCSHLTGALVRPRRCALHLWGFWGSLPCALVAALPSFRSIHSWSSGLSTRIRVPGKKTQGGGAGSPENTRDTRDTFVEHPEASDAAGVCARVSRACPVCVPAPPGVFLPVYRNQKAFHVLRLRVAHDEGRGAHSSSRKASTRPVRVQAVAEGRPVLCSSRVAP